MKKINLLLLFVLFGLVAGAQQKIGGTPGVADPNAYLQLGDSATANKGLLMPRVKLTATDSPAPLTAHKAGMYVYNVVVDTAGKAEKGVLPGMYYNDGMQWVKVQNTDASIFIYGGPVATLPSVACNATNKNTIFVDTAAVLTGTETDNPNFGKQWICDGTGWKTYTPPPGQTAWFKYNTAIDAGGDKAGSIYRTGNVAVGVRQAAVGANTVVLGGQNDTAKGSVSAVLGGALNKAYGSYSVVIGGYKSTASGKYSSVIGAYGAGAIGQASFVAGGGGDTARGQNSVVLGGSGNLANASYSSVIGAYFGRALGVGSFVAGGGGDTASGQNSVVLGGEANKAGGFNSLVVGGAHNKANIQYSAVIGGYNSTASGTYSSVIGAYGAGAIGVASFVAGGGGDSAYGQNSAVLGGEDNHTNGKNSAILGGLSNIASGISSGIVASDLCIATNHQAFVAGGTYDTASGAHSVVLAGSHHSTLGANSAIIGGQYLKNTFNGSAMMGDNSSTTPVNSLVANSYTSMFNGGYRFLTNRAAQNRGVFINDSTGAATQLPTLDVHGSMAANVIEITGNYTVTATDYMVVSTSSATVTVTLPAANLAKGRMILLSANGSTTGMVSAKPAAADKIAPIGAAALAAGAASTAGTSIKLVSNGVDTWYVMP